MSSSEKIAVNLLDPGVFATGRDYAMYAHLRDHDPVHWHEPVPPLDRGLWAIIRYDDVVTVVRDPATYTLARQPDGSGRPSERASIHSTDGLRQTKLHRLLLSHFTPRTTQALRERVERIVQSAVSAAVGGGERDFVADVAAKVSWDVLGEVLGIPGKDRPLVGGWHKLSAAKGLSELVFLHDPDYHPPPRATGGVGRQLYDYIHELTAARRAHPANDLVSTLATAEIDGVPLTHAEIDANVMLLLAAGNGTVRDATSIGLHALLTHPAQRQALLDGEVPVSQAVEEIVRYASPVIQMPRTVTRDMELHGRQLRRGDKVLLFFASANRDPAIFDDPESFLVGRSPNRHIGFGYGPHYCLGARLARLQIEVVLQCLLPHLDRLRLTESPERRPSVMIRGIKRMPVVFS